jgi:hypothetical protein
MEKKMSYSFTQGSTSSDATRVGSHGAVTPGTPDSIITFPEATGIMSLGPSIIASGIITMSALTAGSGSGSVSVSGLTATDVVVTSIDTDASGSSFFYTKVDTSADTISFRGLTVSGSTYAKCHYVVYRSI